MSASDTIILVYSSSHFYRYPPVHMAYSEITTIEEVEVHGEMCFRKKERTRRSFGAGGWSR